MKNNLILPVSIGVAILGCVLAVSANINAIEIKKNLEKERYQRMDVERRLQDSMQKAGFVQRELGHAERKISDIQNIINAGQASTNQLKSQMESTAKENEALRQSVKKLQDDLNVAAAAQAQSEAAVTANVTGAAP